MIEKQCRSFRKFSRSTHRLGLIGVDVVLANMPDVRTVVMAGHLYVRYMEWIVACSNPWKMLFCKVKVKSCLRSKTQLKVRYTSKELSLVWGTRSDSCPPHATPQSHSFNYSRNKHKCSRGGVRPANAYWGSTIHYFNKYKKCTSYSFDVHFPCFRPSSCCALQSLAYGHGPRTWDVECFAGQRKSDNIRWAYRECWEY